jgi:hypothetical protein
MQNKILFSLITFFILPATHVWAATIINTNSNTGGVSTSKVNPFQETPVTMDIATGIAVMNGVSMPGLNFGLYTRLIKQTPVYFGIETSAFFDTVGQTGALVPVLAGTYVEFELSPKVKPTLGVLTGPAFVVNSTAPSNHTTYALLLRPGMDFVLAKNVGLNLQSRFGVIGSSFVVIPQLGTAISFN